MNFSKYWILVGAILVTMFLIIAAFVFKGRLETKPPVSEIVNTSGMKIESPVFGDGKSMPPAYTCDGENVNPPLNISGVPSGTASLALIFRDPDAPGGDWIHWLVWNINPSLTAIAENSVPPGATVGRSDFGPSAYGGPCPPYGTHRYVFELYALNSNLDLTAGSKADDLRRAMNGKVKAAAVLAVPYARR